MIQLCRHIFHRGTACKGAAVRGTEFCRHHSSVKAALAHVQPRPDRYGLHKPLPFVYPEDRAAIQTNLFLVLQAFNDRKIDTRTANCMTYNLQVCRVNLGNQPLAEPSAAGANAEEMVRRVILTPDGDEIAPPREALEPGEESPLHHAGCPCQRCAEQYRNAPPEQHHPNCQCGLCEDSPSGHTRLAHETDSPSQPSEETTGAPSLEPEATRVGNDELSSNDQPASAHSVLSAVKNNSEPSTENWGLGTDNCQLARCDKASASSALSVVKNNFEPITDNWGLTTDNCELTRTAPATNLGAPSLEPEATRVGSDEPWPNDQSPSAHSASSVVKNNPEPSNNGCHPERSEELDHGETPIKPLRRSVRVQVEGQGFSPAINTTLRRSDLSAEGPSAAIGEATRLRAAPATKLYDQELTKDPVNQPFNLADYLYGDAHKKHEAQYAARARAAIEAGLEPPPYEPFDPSKVESEDDRRYREDREQIERNRESARLAWNKLHPDEPVQYTPYLTWGEQHDLKLAQAKKQKEEEEARAREQS